MSKNWTEHQGRADHIADADQIAAEFQATQSSITTLDRTQTPALAYDDTYIAANAMNQMWPSNTGNPLWGSGSSQGEQTNHQTATGDAIAYQFLGVTYQSYNGGWETGDTQTLSGFAGGSLFIEWSGMAAIFPGFQQTQNNDHPPNPKYMRLRIRVNGVVLVERQGVAKSMDTFRIFGTGLFPAGDLEVEYQWRFTPAGQDDPIVDTTPKHLMQAHLFGCKTLAIARYR